MSALGGCDDYVLVRSVCTRGFQSGNIVNVFIVVVLLCHIMKWYFLKSGTGSRYRIVDWGFNGVRIF